MKFGASQPITSIEISTSFQIDSVSDGLSLAGLHWSCEQPVAVVSLVHGFGEHCGRYEILADHLVQNGIAVVGVDLRGHGKTQGPRGIARKYSDVVGDVETLVRHTAELYPDTAHFLFGHSMGGGLVLHYGMNDQTDSLSGYLASAPLIHAKRRLPFYVRAAVKMLRMLMPGGSMPISVSGKKISNIPKEQDRYDNDPLNHNRLGFGLGVGMIEAGQNVLANAAKWGKPLCLWHSKADQITDFNASARFAAEAKNCEFTTFAGVQHEMHHDTSRDKVHALIAEYVLGRSAV